MPEKIDSTEDEFLANLAILELPTKNILVFFLNSGLILLHSQHGEIQLFYM